MEKKNEWTPITWESLGVIVAVVVVFLTLAGSFLFWVDYFNPNKPMQQITLTCLNGMLGTISGKTVSETQVEMGCSSAWPTLQEHLKKVCPDGWSVYLDATSSPEITCAESFGSDYMTVTN